MKRTRFLMMAFAAMAAALAMTSCDKDDNGSGSNGSSTLTRYTLTVQPNKAEWGTATGGGRYNSGARVAIEATPNTGYYFIKWSDGAESNPRTVTVSCDMTLYALFSATPNDPNPYNPDDTLAPGPGPNPHDPDDTLTPGPGPQPSGDWIDLGLPSGLLWAKCNLGATKPEGYGSYYAWGDTATKNTYSWSTYRYCTVDDDGRLLTLLKYNTGYTYGTPDSLAALQSMDDAATQALGDGARTPTKQEWRELINNTTVEWTTLNGVNGRMFTATNGNTLFLPAAGNRHGSEFYYAGSEGYYWSSSLLTGDSDNAWCFYFASGSQFEYDDYRYFGFSVRAVRQN